MEHNQSAAQKREVIGITGGIGVGKSVVSRILRLKGYPVYDCDMEARRLMENNPEVIASLIELLGDDIYTPGGRLDRQRMSQLIFSDDAAREGVNGIVHAAVRDDFKRWTIESDSQEVFVESAILATSGMDDLCSQIWIVDAPVPTRIERVMKRNGMREQDVMERIAVQTREIDSLPLSKCVVIDNGGDSSVLEQIVGLLKHKNIDN